MTKYYVTKKICGGAEIVIAENLDYEEALNYGGDKEAEHFVYEEEPEHDETDAVMVKEFLRFSKANKAQR